MKPFLKWAGNKYQIVERIKAVLPPGKRLIEPFVGSGAVFVNTDYDEYLLADANKDLVNLYLCLQRDGDEFINYCKSFFILSNNTSVKYYELRTQFNSITNVSLKSALFVYLNRHCFNGLCRYNSKAKFNVPFGSYTKPYFPEKEMQSFCHKAKFATFIHADFITIMESATANDVVYCDPPYVPLSATSSFTDYSPVKFGTQEQEKLANLAMKLALKGIPVIISNHDTEFTQKAYQQATIVPFEVQRYISCNGSGRNKVSELLAIFRNGSKTHAENSANQVDGAKA